MGTILLKHLRQTLTYKLSITDMGTILLKHLRQTLTYKQIYR